MAEIFVVTGSNAGLGLHTARHLAQSGKTVVVTGRNSQRLVSAVEQVKAAGAGSGGDAVGLPLNLASLAAVEDFAGQLRSRFLDQPIKGLVLNAGVNEMKFSWSEDGVESTFATNHLGHFHLVQLLLPHLAPDARIVVTASGVHDPATKAPLAAPKWEHPSEVAMLKSELNGVPPSSFDGGLAYTRSKLSNILFTYELARRLQQQGSKVTVSAYDPGFCPDTELSRNIPGPLRPLFSFLVPWYMWFMRSPQRPSTAPKSGAYQARLAADPAFAGVSGKYFSIDHEEASSADSHKLDKQAQLWAYSEELVARLVAARG